MSMFSHLLAFKQKSAGKGSFCVRACVCVCVCVGGRGGVILTLRDNVNNNDTNH